MIPKPCTKCSRSAGRIVRCASASACLGPVVWFRRAPPDHLGRHRTSAHMPHTSGTRAPQAPYAGPAHSIPQTCPTLIVTHSTITSPSSPRASTCPKLETGHPQRLPSPTMTDGCASCARATGAGESQWGVVDAQNPQDQSKVVASTADASVGTRTRARSVSRPARRAPSPLRSAPRVQCCPATSSPGVCAPQWELTQPRRRPAPCVAHFWEETRDNGRPRGGCPHAQAQR